MGLSIAVGALLNMSEDEAKKLKIGVALSGGRDSVALLHLLFGAGYDITAINVEHGIRGEESLRDSLFVRSLCETLGVPLLAYSVDAPAFARENGYTLEQGARILRYRIFDEILRSGTCDYIALAHHLDDQVETVLMRILRGTGVKGLVGMRAVSGRYLRPLLNVSREQIDEYVKQNGLEFMEDSTNDDRTYTRNFLRGEISVLKTRFPALSDAVARLSSNAREAEEFISAYVPEPALKDGEAYVKTSDLANIAVAKRLVFKAAESLGVKQDIEERHYPLIMALKDAESGKRLQLTHELDVHKQGEFLVFAKRASQEGAEEIPFGEGVFEEFGLRVERVFADDLPSEFGGADALYIDADSVPSGAMIRHRRQGDRIAKFGGGEKSLGDFLTDKKVPKRARDSLAIIAVGNMALAVAGVDISADCKITPTTKSAYKIQTIK